MWIEEEIHKDSVGIQRVIQTLTRDYHKQLPRSIRSHIPENHEKNTEFLNHFYDQLRNAEFIMYQSAAADAAGDAAGDEPRRPAFQLTEIKNSVNDLPHPRILSDLQRAYDIRRKQHSASDSDADDAQFIPYKVYAYIREKSEYCIKFQSTIHGRAISLYFITFPESHITACNKGRGGVCASEIAVYQQYAYKVFIWLSLVTSLADKECSEKSLNVYFYMTPFKKERPTDDAILSAIHVNTGLTRNCQTHGEIVVYRTEEWFKVFVHESMHNFNMDFIDLDLRVANEQLRRTFCIPHDDILLFETYTETWARIINTMFDTYFHQDQSPAADRAHFIRTVREKLTTNSVFYAYQVVKVLEIMGLKYANITIQSAENTEVCRKRYAEDTNVYAYYILGGILSVYALPFISWCCAHNRGSGGRIGAVRFSHEKNNLTRFVEFIMSASRDPTMLSLISFIESSAHTTPVMKKTMRMTIE